MAMPDIPIPADLALPDGQVPFTDDDFYAWVEADDPLESDLDARVGAWLPENDELAEWAGRKLAAAKAESAALQEQATEWAARIGHWFEQASRRPKKAEAFFQERLEEYALRRRDAGLPATLILPSVEIRTTLTKPAVVVVDDEVAADYIDAQGGEEWAAAHKKAWPSTGPEAPEIVRRDAKVFVVPLRKLVAVVELPATIEWQAYLACGHRQDGTVWWGTEESPAQEDDFSIPDVGQVIICAECSPPDGPGVTSPVEDVYKITVRNYAAVGPDNIAVPGLAVAPEKITPKVTTR